MGKLLRPLFLLALVLAVPIVPFLLVGQRLEFLVTGKLETVGSSTEVAGLVVTLLASDIVLPVPSSMISTFGGARLGWLAGTGASWLGMNLGAALGFGVARRWGQPVALWFASPADLDRMQDAVRSWGSLLLVATRALPVLAEATVLLFGLHRLPWRQFLPPVLLSNLGIAVAYSALGDWAQQHAWLPWALGTSGALPLLIAALIRRYVGPRN